MQVVCILAELSGMISANSQLLCLVHPLFPSASVLAHCHLQILTKHCMTWQTKKSGCTFGACPGFAAKNENSSRDYLVTAQAAAAAHGRCFMSKCRKRNKTSCILPLWPHKMHWHEPRVTQFHYGQLHRLSDWMNSAVFPSSLVCLFLANWWLNKRTSCNRSAVGYQGNLPVEYYMLSSSLSYSVQSNLQFIGKGRREGGFCHFCGFTTLIFLSCWDTWELL